MIIDTMLVPKIASTALKLNAPTKPQFRPPITSSTKEIQSQTPIFMHAPPSGVAVLSIGVSLMKDIYKIYPRNAYIAGRAPVTTMEWNPSMDIVTDSRHKYFLHQAYKSATECSDDPFTKVGAVLVRKEREGYRMFARGANVLPRSIEGTQSDLAGLLADRAWKNANMNHAEKVVIEIARLYNAEVKGSIMYMPWIPCEGCADEIKKAGIAELVGHKAMIMKTPERWWESTNKALEDLKRQGVICRMYDGKIGNVFSTFNGEVWTP